MQDIIERLATELSTAPAGGFDIGRTVASGRRAVRRRRVAAGGLALAAVLVVGGTVWAVVPGGDPEAGRNDHAATTTPTPTPSVPASTDPLVKRPDGSWEVNPAATSGGGTGFRAATGEEVEAFRVTLGSKDYYAYFVPAGSDAEWIEQPSGEQSLEEWVESQRAQHLQADAATWLRIDEASVLSVARQGLRILSQQPDPGLGDRFAAPGEPTAVAEVEREGVRYFVAVRPSPGAATADAVAFVPTRRVGSLAAFVEHARKQYGTDEQGGSEGLR